MKWSRYSKVKRNTYPYFVKYEVGFYDYKVNFNSTIIWSQFSTVPDLVLIKNVLVPRTSHVKGLHVRSSFYLSRTIGHRFWRTLIGLVDLPIRMKGNSKCISGNSLNPLEAQNKELGVASQTLLTEAELSLRRRLPLVPNYDFPFGINEYLPSDNWINFFSPCRSLIRQSIFPWNRAATLVEPPHRLPHPVVTAISPILRARYRIGWKM